MPVSPKHRVGRMAQICPAEQVTDRARLHGFADQAGHRLGNLVQGGETLNAAHQRVRKPHDEQSFPAECPPPGPLPDATKKRSGTRGINFTINAPVRDGWMVQT